MPDFPEVLVVGMHFRGQDAVDIAGGLSPGTVLRLEREPENAYDGNAIKVFYEDMHLGYIERGQAAWIAPHMDEGLAHAAVITGHQQKGRNLHPVVLVRERLPEVDEHPS